MKYVLTANNTLIVRGPASFRLLEGEASILSAPLLPTNKLIVRGERQIPVEAMAEVQLEIHTGKFGGVYELDGSTIPASWNSAAESLVEMQEGTVMVIGASDAGKSTFCTYLANRILKNNIKTRIIDADVGQADIGPPTTVGSAYPTTFLYSLVDLKPEAQIFIGHTSPKQVETKLIDAIGRLTGRSHGGLTIINTDGWVLDPEVESYKVNMITAMEPDLVVGLSESNELQPILSRARAACLRIDTAKEVLSRTRSDRRAIRSSSYRRHLEGGRTHVVFLPEISLLMPKGFPPIHEFTSRDLEGLVLGLLDDSGYMLHFGILLDVENDKLRVFSKSVEGVRRVEVGYVRLSMNGTELGYFEPWMYR